MSDYWDHPEYGELEGKYEKQVATTRKWMALHDEVVERERHKEQLLGQVWDICRDNNLGFQQRVIDTMVVIREKPESVKAIHGRQNSQNP